MATDSAGRTIIYLDSNAGGANDGTTKADAFTTIQGALTAWTTSDVIWMQTKAANEHSETIGVDLTAAADGRTAYLQILGVDFDTDGRLDSAAANITFSADVEFLFYGAAHGMYIDCNGWDFLNTSSDCSFHLIDGVIDGVVILGGNNLKRSIHTTNCSIPGSTALVLNSIYGAMASMHICPTITGTAETAGLASSGASFNAIDIKGGDLSGMTIGTLLDRGDYGAATPLGVNISAAKMPASYSLDDGDYSGVWVPKIDLNVSGNDDYYIGSGTRGVIEADTGIYYDSGWQDYEDTQRLSYKMTPGAHADLEEPVLTPWFDGPLVKTTGSKTLTVEAWENFTTALQDDEVDLEAIVPGTAGSPAHTVFVTTRTLTGVETQADLTAGAGTGNWTGETGGRSVKFELSATFNNVGTFQWRISLRKYEAGKQFNFDPLIVVT